jgi:hypothetical protein
MVHGLEREYEGRIEFVRANIHNDDTIDIQEKYGFSATPEFFLVDGEGNVLAHWDDGITLANMRETFDDVLLKDAAQ